MSRHRLTAPVVNEEDTVSKADGKDDSKDHFLGHLSMLKGVTLDDRRKLKAKQKALRESLQRQVEAKRNRKLRENQHNPERERTINRRRNRRAPVETTQVSPVMESVKENFPSNAVEVHGQNTLSPANERKYMAALSEMYGKSSREKEAELEKRRKLRQGLAQQVAEREAHRKRKAEEKKRLEREEQERLRAQGLDMWGRPLKDSPSPSYQTKERPATIANLVHNRRSLDFDNLSSEMNPSNETREADLLEEDDGSMETDNKRTVVVQKEDEEENNEHIQRRYSELNHVRENVKQSDRDSLENQVEQLTNLCQKLLQNQENLREELREKRERKDITSKMGRGRSEGSTRPSKTKSNNTSNRHRRRTSKPSHLKNSKPNKGKSKLMSTADHHRKTSVRRRNKANEELTPMAAAARRARIRREYANRGRDKQKHKKRFQAMKSAGKRILSENTTVTNHGRYDSRTGHMSKMSSMAKEPSGPETEMMNSTSQAIYPPQRQDIDVAGPQYHKENVTDSLDNFIDHQPTGSNNNSVDPTTSVVPEGQYNFVRAMTSQSSRSPDGINRRRGSRVRVKNPFPKR